MMGNRGSVKRMRMKKKMVMMMKIIMMPMMVVMVMIMMMMTTLMMMMVVRMMMPRSFGQGVDEICPKNVNISRYYAMCLRWTQAAADGTPMWASYEMLPPVRVGALIAPADVSIVIPLKLATPSASVFSSGCTASQSFFFWTCGRMEGSSGHIKVTSKLP